MLCSYGRSFAEAEITHYLGDLGRASMVPPTWRNLYGFTPLSWTGPWETRHAPKTVQGTNPGKIRRQFTALQRQEAVELY